MATEAQRLMMMSLGKIQGCRQQRGGINLFKSLLVTKVLYHARSVAMTENTPAKEDSESEDQRVPEIDMNEEEEEESPVPEPVSESHAGDLEESAGKPQNKDIITQSSQEHTRDNEYQNKENMCPQNNVPKNYPISAPEDFAESQKQDSSSDKDIDRQCSRCVKRRLTELEAAVDSITPKKQRKDSDYEEYAIEPMQVETTQISNLVNRFSSGFTGLLATDSDNTQCQEESPVTEVQGHSDSLLSCSNQIKESFELLARPIIALSV